MGSTKKLLPCPLAEFKVIIIPDFHSNRCGFNITDMQSYEKAKELLDVLSNYTWYLHKIGLMDKPKNIGFIKKYENSKWVEYDVPIRNC